MLCPNCKKKITPIDDHSYVYGGLEMHFIYCPQCYWVGQGVMTSLSGRANPNWRKRVRLFLRAQWEGIMVVKKIKETCLEDSCFPADIKTT